MENGFAESFHGAFRVHGRDAVVLGLEAALQEEVTETLDELFEVERVGGFASVFGVAGEFHGVVLVCLQLLSIKLGSFVA